MNKHPIPAVRAIIINKELKALFFRRKATKFAPGEWCLPGGKVDYGESVEQALVRELKEETSLRNLRYLFLFYLDSVPTESDASHYITFYFDCLVEGRINLSEESSEYAWIGLEDFKRYKIAFGNDLAFKKYLEERWTKM